jgi:hypothetical protein
MSLRGYWAYDLRIHTELECPELPSLAVDSGDPDVTVRLLPARADALEALENGYYEVHSGVFSLAIPGVAHYRVEEGQRIFVTPLPDAPTDKVRLFLLGSAMGAVLYQRGLFPIHGSAIETPWGAMIFVGAQGAGKSTLAAQFHRKGYRLLCDDVCAVASTPEGLRILPALAQLRLCTDAYERLGFEGGARFDVDKFVVPIADGYCSRRMPLRAIHILSDHDGAAPEFKVLRGFERIQRLFENLYRPHYLKGQTTQSGLMRMAALIAQQATMIEVKRRRDAEAIGELAGFFESEWTKCFGPPPPPPPAKEND